MPAADVLGLALVIVVFAVSCSGASTDIPS
jgi:hypothetical protein